MGGDVLGKMKNCSFYFPWPIFLNEEIGTLSKDNEDGSENVGKKRNLHSLKLNRVYLDPLNMSNAGEFPGVEFLRILFTFNKRKENSLSYVHSM